MIRAAVVEQDAAVEVHLRAGEPPADDAIERATGHPGARPVDADELAAVLARASAVWVWPTPGAPGDGAPTLILDRPVESLWNAEQCAQHLGVERRTWLSYVSRPGKKNPAPQPEINVHGLPLWDPAAVRRFGENRSPSMRQAASAARG